MAQPYEIIRRPPFFLWLIRLRFPAADFRYIVFTFATKIYSNTPVEGHLLAHELTHLEQQGYSRLQALRWWLKYALSTQFRFEQELEAYRRQYRHAEGEMRDRNKLNTLLQKLAQDLSGELYNQCCSFEEAQLKIKNG